MRREPRNEVERPAGGEPESLQSLVLPGRKPVLEMLERDPGRVDVVLVQRGLHGKDSERVLDACREAGVRFRLAPRQELDKLFAGAHQGVAARLLALRGAGLEDVLDALVKAPLPLILALDQVQDPGNVGTLARTLFALGGAGIVMPKDRSAHLGPAAMKASAGALGQLPVARVVNLARALDQCLDAGLTIYAAQSGPGSQSAWTAPLFLPAVLVLGNEEQGVRPNVAKRCATRLAIPLARDFDSLNVAQAGAILVAQFARSRPR
jgi:23S rRNA (guanosine2251-2'-O)-methyltransferase